MPITITVQEAKFVLELLASYQRQHMSTTTAILQEAEKGKDNFMFKELEKYEEAIIAIYRAGYFGDRLEELISDAQASNE